MEKTTDTKIRSGDHLISCIRFGLWVTYDVIVYTRIRRDQHSLPRPSKTQLQNIKNIASKSVYIHLFDDREFLSSESL